MPGKKFQKHSPKWWFFHGDSWVESVKLKQPQTNPSSNVGSNPKLLENEV